MFQFSIEGWRAVSSRMATDEQWQAWAQDAASVSCLPEFRPELGWLPAMQRRRLNVPARLMMDAMRPLFAEDARMPVVYSSHDGEINRSIALWLSLLREEGVSPTSFGLSVHNALVGQWSMLRGDMSESTAICAREDGLEAAFAEAAGMLDEGVPKVMVVQADDPMAEDHPVPLLRAPLPYAVAFVLVPGSDWQLSCISHGTGGCSPGDEPDGDYWGALHWVGHVLRGADDFTHRYSQRSWHWKRLR